MASIGFVYLCLGFFFVAVCAVTPEEQKAFDSEMLLFGKECAADLGIDEDDIIKQIQEKNFKDCFVKCVFEKIGMMKDGNFDIDGSKAATKKFFKSHDDQQKFDETTDKCKKVNDEIIEDDKEDCKRATLLMNCIMESRKNIMFV